jgi:ATP-dependent Clp protease ATP-binding subunit ClpC
MGLLVAGTKYRGEFEERLKKLMEEIKQNDDIILVSAPFHAKNHLCSQPFSCVGV